jgi:hypothetical protein
MVSYLLMMLYKLVGYNVLIYVIVLRKIYHFLHQIN